MDRCPHCNKRMLAVLGDTGRTEFKCLERDKVDPLKTDAAKRGRKPSLYKGRLVA